MQFCVSVCTLVLLGETWDGSISNPIQFLNIFLQCNLCLGMNFSIFLVIGRTRAVTVRAAGVLKDWILIALSTVIFPESIITGLNIIGYAIALCGVMMYNYIKVKDSHTSQLPIDLPGGKKLPIDSVSDKISKNWKLEKKSFPDSSDDNNEGGIMNVDEEVSLIPSSRLSHIGRSQVSNHGT